VGAYEDRRRAPAPEQRPAPRLARREPLRGVPPPGGVERVGRADAGLEAEREVRARPGHARAAAVVEPEPEVRHLGGVDLDLQPRALLLDAEPDAPPAAARGRSRKSLHV
jgi:hypothetical protein